MCVTILAAVILVGILFSRLIILSLTPMHIPIAGVSCKRVLSILV